MTNKNNKGTTANTSLVASNTSRASQTNSAELIPENGQVVRFGASSQTNDYLGSYNREVDAAYREAERRRDSANTQFQEESIRRGFGLRTPAPIRSEELKANTFRLGFWFAMVLATILGVINANQTIDLYGIEFDWLAKFIIIIIAVAFTLFAFKWISKSYLTATMDLNSFRNQGAAEIRRWFKKLGLLFIIIAIPALFLRMDVGVPEIIGIALFVLWEFVTVMIASLCSIAYEYFSWSGDLAKDYEAAIASVRQF